MNFIQTNEGYEKIKNQVDKFPTYRRFRLRTRSLCKLPSHQRFFLTKALIQNLGVNNTVCRTVY